MLRPKHRFY
jgi:hypothetical protein